LKKAVSPIARRGVRLRLMQYFPTAKILTALILIIACSNSFAGENNSDSFFAMDKLQHFSLSIAAAAGTGFVMHNHFDTDKNEAIIIGFTASFSLGGIKEIIDSTKPAEHSSLKDLAVDFLGSIIGAALLTAVIK